MTSYNKTMIFQTAMKMAGEVVLASLLIRFILVIAAFLLPESKTTGLDGFTYGFFMIIFQLFLNEGI
jgi:hypothetical protein